MTMSKNEFKKIALTAARAADSKKAHPVLVYDLAGRSQLADYAVVAAVESAPQLDAVEEEISIKLKHEGSYCLHKDGMRSKNWKVLDYGGVLVHVYDVKAAEFYAVDRIYTEYKTVVWEEAPAAPAAKKEPEAKPAAPAAKKPAAKKPAAKKPAVKKAAAKKAAPKKAAVKKAKPAKKPAKAKKAAPAKKAKPAKKTAKKK